MREQRAKKYTVLVLLVVVCAMLLTACNSSFDPEEVHSPVESGYGRIKISFVGEEMSPYMAVSYMARTVFPSKGFDKYVYTFTNVDEEDETGEPIGVEKEPNNEGYFALEVGNYMVAVQAFIGGEEPYTLAATGESLEFTVGPGDNEPVEVRLVMVDTEVQQGVFSYTITYPQDAEPEIILQKWSALNGLDGVTLTDITLVHDDLTDDNVITGTLPLEAGSYLLTVRMKKEELFAGISEAVQIYPLITTVFSKDFNDNDFLAVIPPTIIDYNISGMGTFVYDGDARTASVTRKINASTGVVTVLYNEETTEPVNAGTYTVTFDVEAAPGWSAATDLPAGSIIINKAIGAEVSAPTLNTKTHNSIIIDPETASTGQDVEYGINTSNTAPSVWQSALTFDNLVPARIYYIFARAAGSGNYETGAVSNSLAVTTLQTILPGRIEYYWVNEHDSLVTTNGGAVSIDYNENLTITAQGEGYDVKQWYLNGKINTDHSGETYNFSSRTVGKHTVGLLVEKGGKLYNTNITITVRPLITITDHPASRTVAAGSISGSMSVTAIVTPDATPSYRWYSNTANNNTGGTVISGATSETYTIPTNLMAGTYYYFCEVMAAGAVSVRSSVAAVTVISATNLNFNTWSNNGNITSSSGQQWFRFTATSASAQRILVNINGTLPRLHYQVYDSNFNTVRDEVDTLGTTGTIFTAISPLTIGQVYYIRVWPYGSYSGTYQIAFN